MSNISTIFDDFKSFVEATLPDHVQLVNPYLIELNDELTLRQGFGIKLGSGENTNRNLNCKYSLRRDFSLIITRKFYARDLDVDSKETTEKLILEDLNLMITGVEKSPTIGSSAITNVYYSSDDGIEYVFDENQTQFLKVECIFPIEYFEELTP